MNPRNTQPKTKTLYIRVIQLYIYIYIILYLYVVYWTWPLPLDPVYFYFLVSYGYEKDTSLVDVVGCIYIYYIFNIFCSLGIYVYDIKNDQINNSELLVFFFK